MKNLISCLLCLANCLYAGHEMLISGDYGCLPILFHGCENTACSSRPRQVDSSFLLFDVGYLHRHGEMKMQSQSLSKILNDSGFEGEFSDKKIIFGDYVANFIVAKRNKQNLHFLVWEKIEKDSLGETSRFYPSKGDMLLNDRRIKNLIAYVNKCADKKW